MQNPDVLKSGLDPALHYLSNGWKEGRNPGPKFNTKKYLEEHPECKICPLIFEYNQKSKTQSKSKSTQSIAKSSEYFDEAWYLAHYPEVACSGLDPYEHYDTIGWKKGYDPSEKFDTVGYLTKYPDIAKAKINPLPHFVSRGIKEGRVPKEESKTAAYRDEFIKIYFDSEWYQREYPDVKVSGLPPYEHYDKIGRYKGYNPSKFFNTNFYLDKHKVVAELGINPLEHYLKYGLNLGYAPTDANINYGKLSFSEYAPALSEWWIRHKHEPLNLGNPKTFNEKCQWLKLYDSTPIKTKLADKYLVRDWVKEKIGEQYLIPLLGAYDSFDEIDFDQLPNQFVMKCNHGSGMNIIVKDKSKLDLKDAKSKIDFWMKSNFAFQGIVELQYRDVKPKIVIEKFVTNSGKALYDYKFWCFNGEVKYMQFRDDFSEDLKMVFYDLDWKKQDFYYDHPLYEKPLEKPDNYQEMIDISKKLCQGFSFVCVDLYRLNDGSIKFGEMTFTRTSGLCHWNDDKYNYMLGDMIKLPKLAYNVDTGAYFKLPHECGQVDRTDIPANLLKYPHYNNRIWNNPDFFDEKWYIKHYPRVKKGIAARQHYEKTGWEKGYNPSPSFNTNEYLKQHPECKICPLVFEQNRNGFVDLSICAIMRNEAPYVKEWIDYHRLVGVERFYIYDNESTDNLKEVLTPYIEQGIVVYKYYPGAKPDGVQQKSYNECIREYKNKTQWLALIDADEFIVPVQKNSIPEFLKDYADYPGVILYWMTYDSNGHIEKPKGGLMENYTRVHYNHNCHDDTRTKAIVNPRQTDRAEIHYSHYCYERSGNHSVDSLYRKIIGNPPYITPCYDKIRINHYRSKSYSEFKQKIKKPRAGLILPDIKELYDYSDYQYDYAIYKYIPQMKGKNRLKEFFRYHYLKLKNVFIWLQHRDGRDIRSYIDEKWYAKKYPAYKLEAPNAYEHYMNIGWKKNYNPSLKFNTMGYLIMYPDIARAKSNPLIHYLEKKDIEHRLNLVDYFDRKWYLKQYPEVKKLNIDPIEHYLTVGWKENKNPNKNFDTQFYLSLYKDVASSGLNPFTHYLKQGRNEGRLACSQANKKQIFTSKSQFSKEQFLISQHFNKKWYLKQYPEVKNLNIDPIEHYLTVGWKENKNSSEDFDTNFYLKNNPDVAEAGINPYFHYLRYGKAEGRIAMPPFQKIDLQSLPQTPKDQQNPKISILVASYNYEQYIGETLDSLVNQTYKNFEVIVVDDGSKDNSLKIIRKYVKKYPNVFLHRHHQGANRGLFETIKLGMKKSTGKYIAFCESDDYWLPNNLEEKVNVINKYNSPKIIYNNVKLFGPGKKDQEEYIANLSLIGEGLFKVNPIDQTYNMIPTFSCVMIDKQVLMGCDFNAYIPAWTDWWLYRQILVKYPVYHVDKNLTMWRIHNSYNSQDKACKYMAHYNEFVFYSNELIVKHNKKLIDKVRDIQHVKLLEKSDFFDERYYLKKYPDVKKFKLPPVYHYFTAGWEKGYNPSAKFNTNAYLNLYPDIMNLNPLVHYLVAGQKEKRVLVSDGQTATIHHSNESQQTNKAVLLVSNLLNLTGAPMLLYSVAKILLKKGYKVVVLSAFDGDLRKQFLEVGADVIIDTQIYGNDTYPEYLKKYDFAYGICNTLINTSICQIVSQRMPAILWVHENTDKLSFKLALKLSQLPEIYVPSALTKQYMDRYNKHVKILSYPAHDLIGKVQEKTPKLPIKIAVCATLAPRKGQDIFIDAIKMIDIQVQKNAEFIILGDEGISGFEKKLKNNAQGISNIKFLSALKNQEDYHKFLDSIDILCCPSREDPCPLVVIDAFMHSIPVVISDHVGQKELIAHGKDGYVFNVADTQQLASILEKLINSEDLQKLQKGSRKLFEQNFSEEQFFKTFEKIMENKPCKK